MRPFLKRVLPVLFCLMLVSANAESKDSWFHKRVIWQADKEPRVWETKIVTPDRKEHFWLALVPLWAVEGGIVGIEILVAQPEHPDDNLLGERETDVPQPFVVTVDELESGINRSQFGHVRTFKLDRTTLRIEIQGSRLGEGVGECKNCKNIQELTVDFICEGNSRKYRNQTTDEKSAAAIAAPVGWHKVQATAFSLFAPAGWEFHQMQGVDSYVGEFVGDGAVLRSDLGRYSSGYLTEAKKPAYVIADESVGGFSAKVVSPRTPGRGVTGIYFHNVGGSNGLCVWGQDLTSAQQELALKMFETIRFGGGMPRSVIPPPAPPKNAH